MKETNLIHICHSLSVYELYFKLKQDGFIMKGSLFSHNLLGRAPYCSYCGPQKSHICLFSSISCPSGLSHRPRQWLVQWPHRKWICYFLSTSVLDDLTSGCVIPGFRFLQCYPLDNTLQHYYHIFSMFYFLLVSVWPLTLTGFICSIWSGHFRQILSIQFNSICKVFILQF